MATKQAFTRPNRYGAESRVRDVLLVILLCGMILSWAVWECRWANRRYQIYEHIESGLYTNDTGEFPWYSGWLHAIVGPKDCFDPECIVFSNFAVIDDGTLAELSELDSLVQLWLNGDIDITDVGLQHLARLKQLSDLSLGDAKVSARAVEQLRKALPRCKITWNGPKQPSREVGDNPED